MSNSSLYEDILDALHAAQAALLQYQADLKYPPAGDSIDRRSKMAHEAWLEINAITDRVVWLVGA